MSVHQQAELKDKNKQLLVAKNIHKERVLAKLKDEHHLEKSPTSIVIVKKKRNFFQIIIDKLKRNTNGIATKESH